MGWGAGWPGRHGQQVLAHALIELSGEAANDMQHAAALATLGLEVSQIEVRNTLMTSMVSTQNAEMAVGLCLYTWFESRRIEHYRGIAFLGPTVYTPGETTGHPHQMGVVEVVLRAVP